MKNIAYLKSASCKGLILPITLLTKTTSLKIRRQKQAPQHQPNPYGCCTSQIFSLKAKKIPIRQIIGTYYSFELVKSFSIDSVTSSVESRGTGILGIAVHFAFWYQITCQCNAESAAMWVVAVRYRLFYSNMEQIVTAKLTLNSLKLETFKIFFFTNWASHVSQGKLKSWCVTQSDSLTIGLIFFDAKTVLFTFIVLNTPVIKVHVGYTFIRTRCVPICAEL